MTNTLNDYSMVLVVASYLVSVLGAFTGLMLSRHITDASGRIRPGWLALASIVFGGCAIWAMHFIGMLAYDPGGPVTYDAAMTLVSLVLPIAITMAGLYVVHRWRGTAAWLTAGIVMGLGVATMHYTGMAAMRVAADMSYDRALVALSLVIAITASAVALRIAVYWHGALRHASSLLMGLAVCGMHYTGMAAMSVSASDKAVNYFEGAVTRPVMEIGVTLAVVCVAVAAVICLFGRQLESAGEASAGA